MNMKTIREYIVRESESSSNWIQNILDDIQTPNESDKVEVYTALYRIETCGSTHLDIYNGYGHLWDEPRDYSSQVYVTSALDIYVFTTDKGNLYGVNTSYFKNSPALLKMFNRRLKGTKGKYWTDNIETVKKFLEEKVDARHIDNMPEGYDWWGYGLFTSKEKARAAADKVSKLHKLHVQTIWSEDKVAELKKLLQKKDEEIKYYQERIEAVKKEKEEINDDIIEYENMKNVASDDFNESLEQNI